MLKKARYLPSLCSVPRISLNSDQRSYVRPNRLIQTIDLDAYVLVRAVDLNASVRLYNQEDTQNAKTQNKNKKQKQKQKPLLFKKSFGDERWG